MRILVQKRKNHPVISIKSVIIAIFFIATFFVCANMAIAAEAEMRDLESLRASVFENQGIIRPENNLDTLSSVGRAVSEFLRIEKETGSSVGKSISGVIRAYDRGGKMLAAAVNESVWGILEMPGRVKKSLSGTVANLSFPKISLPKFLTDISGPGPVPARASEFFTDTRDGYFSAELKFRGAVLSAINFVGSAYETGGRKLAGSVKISVLGILGISEDTSLIVENSFYEFGRGMSDGARGGRKLALALSGATKDSLFAYNSWLMKKASGINDVIMRFPESMAETLGLMDNSTGAVNPSLRMANFWKNFKAFGARQLAVWKCRMDVALCPSAAAPAVAVETIDSGIIKNVLKNMLKEMSVKAATYQNNLPAAEAATTTP